MPGHRPPIPPWYHPLAKTHICIPTYLPTYLPTYIHTYIHAYMLTCLHAYIHTYLHPFLPTFLFIVPADDMGVVEHTQKNDNSHVICKVKKAEKCISPMSSVKCLAKKNHMTRDLCNCLGSKRCKTCHVN